MLKRVREYYQIFGRQGVALAAKRRLSRRLKETRVSVPGIAHPLYLRPRTSDVAAYKQVFVDHVYEIELSNPPRTIVDAGANVGLASIYFASRYPAARIFSIEPEQSNFALLEKNVARYPNVVAIRAALWKDDSVIDLVDPGLGCWGFRTLDPKDSVEGVARDTVQGITIDTIMKKHGVDHVDLLKMDIEGAEREVFEDASKWIGKVAVLIVELHDKLIPGCSRSLYGATDAFDFRWIDGANVFLAREGYVQGRCG